MVYKPFRACFSTGKIHNMSSHCHSANGIKYGNFTDFNCFDEAVKEISNRGKKASKCMRCGWPNRKEG